MEKTAKRIGIALLAVLLVALLCAGIALALPQAETPLSSEGSVNALDTAVRSVTAGGVTYDLTNWEQANDYYDYLVSPSQGYIPIDSQDDLSNFISNNSSDSTAKGALKPYDENGSPIKYDVGEHAGYGSVTWPFKYPHQRGIFAATLDGCGADIELHIAQFSSENDKQGVIINKYDSGDVIQSGLDDTVSMFGEFGEAWWYGALGNLAQGATISNCSFSIDQEYKFLGEETVGNIGDQGWGSPVFCGGVFGAMSNTTINNCTININARVEGAKVNDGTTIQNGIIAFGGIACYSYNSTIGNSSVNINEGIYVRSSGTGSVITYGTPNALAAGMVAISQGLNAYNISVDGDSYVSAELGTAKRRESTAWARAGAIVALAASNDNPDAGSSGFGLQYLAGSTTINGVLSSYTGEIQQQTGSGTGVGSAERAKGTLAGCIGASTISNVVFTTASAATDARLAYNQSVVGYTLTANIDGGGSYNIAFENVIASDLSTLSGPVVTYTAPSESGSILWSYEDDGSGMGEVDMHSDQPYETFALELSRTMSSDRNVTFKTGRKVTYKVFQDSAEITENGGIDAEPVKSKEFDNQPFNVPVLQIWSMDGNHISSDHAVFEQQNTAYWGIFDGNAPVGWNSVDAKKYNVRLTAAYAADTAYDFVDNTNRLIAYKSDNSQGQRFNRNYVFEITQRELSLSITEPQFVYDNQTKSLEFVLNTIADGDDTPSVIATYFDENQSQIDASQVIGAGDYYVTVTGVNDNNYTITNLEEYQNYAFAIDKRPITITPSGYEDLVYNGAAQYPTVEIGNRISENDNQVVTLNYYGSADPNRPLNIDERINVDSYKMIARLSDPANYVLDNSGLTASETVSFDDSSVTISYNIAKADLKFVGETTISFVYSRSVVRTLQALNAQAGTSYYFQPVDENNTADKNIGSVGSDVLFNIIDGPATNNVSNVGTYTIKLSYESDNFNAITQTITAEVTQKPLTLNFNEPYETQFVYGEQPNYTFDAAATGAVSADAVVFDIVYYVNDGDDTVKDENKLDYVPKNAGSYIAAIEVVGAATEAALGNYYVDDSGNSKIAYTINKADVEIAFTGYETALTYNGTEQDPVDITGITGVIASEQDLYNEGTLKVTYTKDGSTADTARNAGEYTLGAAPTADDNGAFVNNYNITNAPTFTVNKAPLSLQLLDVTMDYASATGQAIPYGEGVTHNFVEGQIFDGDDVQEDPNEWLLQIYTLDENDGSELTINGIGTYLFSIRLNPTNSNAGNYELTLTDSVEGAKYPNAPEGVGTLTVEGTAVFHGIRGTSDSGFAVMEEPTDPFTYNIDVTYRGEDIKFSFFTRTTAGSLEGLSFDSFSVEGAVESGLDETTGYPYVVVRNVGTYTATWTLAAQSQDIFFFPNEDGSTSDQNSLTVTIKVGKLDAEIVPNDVSVVYGGTIEYAGFSVVGDEDGTKAAALAADNVQVEYTSTTESTANVGNYDGAVTITGVTFDGTLGDNYNITYSGAADLTVTPKPVTVSLTMSSGTAVYGDPLPTATLVTGEFVGEDASEMTALINEKLVYDRNAGTDKAPSLKDSAIGNYIVTLAEGTGKITITAKQISGVSVAAGTMPYGGSDANIAPAEDGVFFTENPGFLEEDLDELGLAFRYVGQGELSELEPGEHADALQLAITDEVMKGNYNITAYTSNGDLTVQAMVIDSDNVKVTLERDTYDGRAIGYIIQISGVRVEAGEHLTISLTKDGSAVTEIKDAGEYVFAIKGDDTFYQGNVNITVTVNKADISDMDFGLDKTSATYTGSEIQVSANTRVPVALAVTKDGAEAKLVNAGIYTVTVTPTDPNYTGSKEFTFTIDKAPHKAPVEDDLKIEVTWNSVTVTHDEFTVQLSKDGTDWVDTTMGGYDANSSYTLHVRFKEDANHSASSNTIMISGKTAERTAVEFTITDKEEHYNRAVLTITFEEAFSGKVQFSIDGGKTWKDLTVQGGKYVASGLAESSEYTLQVKIPAGDDYLESEVKSVKVKTGIDPAKYTETLAMFGETFSAGDLVNYETLKEQFNGLTEADKAGVDAAKFATITAARDAFVASVNSDIEDIQNVAAKTAGRAVAAAAAAVTAAAIALFIAKRKFI